MIHIGIDTGANTGIAIWDGKIKDITYLSTLSITQAMEVVKNAVSDFGRGDVVVYVEDARLRKWFGNAGREQLQGAGSVKRDAKIWEDFLREQGIESHMIAPKCNKTKLSSEQFKAVAGWSGKTTEHARDAAMLVYGR